MSKLKGNSQGKKKKKPMALKYIVKRETSRKEKTLVKPRGHGASPRLSESKELARAEGIGVALLFVV